VSNETGKILTEKADAAFRQAAIKVIERARQTGTPLILWGNGRVTEHSIEELNVTGSQGSPVSGETCKDTGRKSN
jgi:hypothetical protein